MRFVISFVSAFAWLTIEIMVLLNPSNTLPIKQFGLWGAIFFIFSLLASFFLPFYTLRENNLKKYFVFFGVSLSFMVILVITAGNFFHLDFHTFCAEIILLYFSIFIISLDSFKVRWNKKNVYVYFTVTTVIIFILWTIWLSFMAYAIVTRKEPRWIEASLYTLSNSLIGACLLISGGILWGKCKRTLHFVDENIYFEERNISNVLCAQDCQIIKLFLFAPEKTVKCSDIVKQTKNFKKYEAPDCDKCITEKWSSNSCKNYMNYKNVVLKINKYFELLQIGSIVPACENRREINKYGWTLRFFDDVQFKNTKS